ncbi:MAG: Gldg family protein [Chitinophagaceae bacterium]|nr:Gldg family protein [Chitinophagaceae bacterium]
MRVITKIAKNELRNLFYSPIAWFLFVVLMVLCAFYYVNAIYIMAKSAEITAKYRAHIELWATESMTWNIFCDPHGGFFVRLMQHLYLFVPLLTMGVINREFNNGSIKLLYSSPVSIRKIVWGKFLALAVYNLLLVAIVGIFVISGFFDIRSMDLPPVLSGLLGIWLFLCSLTAIGLFMSSLTHYQIVSAIASFTLLFILSRIGELWQEYDFVRDITWFLSIAGRTEKMQMGLITTKDIVYFLVIVFMFVSFTLFKLQGARETKPWYIKASRYLAVIIIGLTTGYISSRPALTGYMDTTAEQLLTIHPGTQKALKDLGDAPLEVTLYTNLLGDNTSYGLPAMRNTYITQMWEQYQRFKTNIKYNYVYYYAVREGDSGLYKRFPGKSLKQIAGLVARASKVDSSMFRSPEEMSKLISLDTLDYQLMMQLKCQGRSVMLKAGYTDALWPDEMNVIAALKRLVHASLPKIYYVTGNLERSIYRKGEREYSDHARGTRLKNSLVNIGFDVDTLNLGQQDIPSDAAILVLADPKVDLDNSVLSKFQSYIRNGGNMLILGEPGKQYVLNPVLSQIGVQLRNGQLVQPGTDETPDIVSSYLTHASFNLAGEEWLSRFKHVYDHHVFDDTIDVKMHGMAAIAVTSDSLFTVAPLMLTMPGRAWLKMGKLVTDSTAPVLNPLEGDIKERSFPFVTSLSRKIGNKEQRIIVAGDADYLSNLRQIGDWGRGQYSWLVYNQYPVYRPVPYSKDNLLKVGATRAGIQKILYLWILPALLLLTGTILLIRRKRK